MASTVKDYKFWYDLVMKGVQHYLSVMDDYHGNDYLIIDRDTLEVSHGKVDISTHRSKNKGYFDMFPLISLPAPYCFEANEDGIGALALLLEAGILDEKPKHWAIKYKTEEELQENNPWRELAEDGVMPFDQALYSTYLFYKLGRDNEAISIYDNNVKSDFQRFNLHLMPQPWLGNPIRAKIIILNKYPVFRDYEQRVAGSFIQRWPQICEGLVLPMLDRLRLWGMGLPYEGAKTGKNGEITYGDAAVLYDGGYWWKRLWSWRYPEKGVDMEQILENTAIINYVPYYSADFAGLPKGNHLPSQYFTRDLIEYIEAKCPDTIFVVSRGATEWRKWLGRIWDALEEDNRIIELPKTAALKQSLNPKVLGASAYSQIIELLKN